MLAKGEGISAYYCMLGKRPSLLISTPGGLRVPAEVGEDECGGMFRLELPDYTHFLPSHLILDSPEGRARVQGCAGSMEQECSRLLQGWNLDRIFRSFPCELYDQWRDRQIVCPIPGAVTLLNSMLASRLKLEAQTPHLLMTVPVGYCEQGKKLLLARELPISPLAPDRSNLSHLPEVLWHLGHGDLFEPEETGAGGPDPGSQPRLRPEGVPAFQRIINVLVLQVLHTFYLLQANYGMCLYGLNLEDIRLGVPSKGRACLRLNETASLDPEVSPALRYLFSLEGQLPALPPHPSSQEVGERLGEMVLPNLGMLPLLEVGRSPHSSVYNLPLGAGEGYVKIFRDLDSSLLLGWWSSQEYARRLLDTHSREQAKKLLLQQYPGLEEERLEELLANASSSPDREQLLEMASERQANLGFVPGDLYLCGYDLQAFALQLSRQLAMWLNASSIAATYRHTGTLLDYLLARYGAEGGSGGKPLPGQVWRSTPAEVLQDLREISQLSSTELLLSQEDALLHLCCLEDLQAWFNPENVSGQPASPSMPTFPAQPGVLFSI